MASVFLLMMKDEVERSPKEMKPVVYFIQVHVT